MSSSLSATQPLGARKTVGTLLSSPSPSGFQIVVFGDPHPTPAGSQRSIGELAGCRRRARPPNCRHPLLHRSGVPQPEHRLARTPQRLPATHDPQIPPSSTNPRHPDPNASRQPALHRRAGLPAAAPTPTPAGSQRSIGERLARRRARPPNCREPLLHYTNAIWQSQPMPIEFRDIWPRIASKRQLAERVKVSWIPPHLVTHAAHLPRQTPINDVFALQSSWDVREAAGVRDLRRSDAGEDAGGAARLRRRGVALSGAREC